MTEAESAADSRESYTAAIAAMRLRLVVSGDAFPRAPSPELPDGEPVCIITLLAVGGA